MRIIHHRQLAFCYRLSGLLALLLFNSSAVVAQTEPARETTGSSNGSQSGVITGRVVNDNGQPLPNATVYVRSVTSSTRGRSVVSDRDGKFEITGLGPAAYGVSANLAAHTPLLRDADRVGPTYYHSGNSITLVLVKGGVITGTVTTQSGEPLVGVLVRAKLLSDNGQRPDRYSFSTLKSKTDDRGVYRIYGLPGGTYVVSAGGGGSDNSGLDPYDRDVPTYSPSSSSDTAARIEVNPGQESNNVDIRYRGEPGRSISGRSIPDGHGRIFLTSANDGGSRLEAIAYLETGIKGFVFTGVDDGDYDLTAHIFVGDDLTLSEPSRIEVRGADVTGLELTTKPLGSVSGRVILREPAKAKCDDRKRPLFAETLVFAAPKKERKEQLRFTPYPGFAATADSQGHVTLKHLFPGQYYFGVQFSANSWYLESVQFTTGAKTRSSKPTDASKVWTTIKSGDRLAGLTLTLAEGGASLQGHIALTEEETLSEGLFVVLVPADAENADNALRFYFAPVSRDGKITMKNLAPGRYWIQSQSLLDEGRLAKLRLPDEAAIRSGLRREAETAKVEIEFKPCENVVEFPVPLKRPADQ